MWPVSKPASYGVSVDSTQTATQGPKHEDLEMKHSFLLSPDTASDL